MPVQSFDDRFLGNADVPQTGSMGGKEPAAVTAKAVGMGAVQTFDPAMNPRANPETLMAAADRVPSTKPTYAKGVDSFNDDTV